MNKINVSAPKGKIISTIHLPSSKSICNRALVIKALSKGKDKIENLSHCDDTQVMIKALENMPHTIDIKAAGTAMRFLTAYLSVTDGCHIITGTERMKQRPIGILVDALRNLGADIEYIEKEGFPPLKINGHALNGQEISLPGNVSSQYISALMMIGPTMKNGLKITLEGEIISKPYINMTMRIMHEFGAKAEWTNHKTLTVHPEAYKHAGYYVESDWSAASYWYEIAALSEDAEITLPGLFEESMQGDSEVSEIFSLLGITTEHKNNNIVLRKGSRCTDRLEYEFINQPDLAQTFVVTCCMMNIPFKFTGLQSLKIKETDRIAALIKEMSKLGYVINDSENSILEWNGQRCETNLDSGIDTYEDHRMAMAFAPATLKVGNLTINNPHVVSKSYPYYWKDLLTAGFGINEL